MLGGGRALDAHFDNSNEHEIATVHRMNHSRTPLDIAENSSSNRSSTFSDLLCKWGFLPVPFEPLS